jgi:hypothetical protein
MNLFSKSTSQAAQPEAGFNWGAFLLTWIWALGNRSLNATTVVLLLLCVIPYLGVASAVALAVYSGRTGNRLAWKNKKWADKDHFLRVQRRWAVIGAAQFALALILLTVMPFFYEK